MAYSFANPTMGLPDIGTAYTTLGTPGVGNLPSVTTEAVLGEIRDAWDATLGGAKFIFLKVPVSTAIAAGTLVQWDLNYTAAAVPAGATSKNTGVAVAVAYTAIASSTSVQYAWFLIQGQVAVLKTAVKVSPASPIYISATAGRIKVLSSAGQQILGGRSMNTATITTTTSTVNVYIGNSMLEGV